MYRLDVNTMKKSIKMYYILSQNKAITSLKVTLNMYIIIMGKKKEI